MQSNGTGDRSASFLEEGVAAGAERDVGNVLISIAQAGQLISRELPSRVGMTKEINPFGERQAELDVFTNDSFSRALIETNAVAWVASEEMEKPLRGSTPEDGISVAMDPLDGSSNIRTNNPLGSIFGLWRGPLPQSGRKLIASAFITYGPTLSITLSVNGKVDQYVEVRKGKDAGRFALLYNDLKLPAKPEVYGFGGERSDWLPQVEKFVSSLEARGLHLRYGGTFIGDYNQVIQRGGIFSYPIHKSKPQGKLRIMYETAPVSFITELAGGSSSNGQISILDIEPKKLSETSPFYVGNTSLIRELENLLRRN